MSRRDDGEQAEYLQIELDTYLDRRTAYMFGVTASGVRLDHYHPTDNEDDADASSIRSGKRRTAIDADGWTAELLAAVFAAPLQRSARARLGPEHQALAAGSQRGGLLGRHRAHRAWLVVAVRRAARDRRRQSRARGWNCCRTCASSSRMTGNRDPDNPFDDGMNLGGRVGADMKVGIGSNLTLEATINPDFGQIEADPAEVNLTSSRRSSTSGGRSSSKATTCSQPGRATTTTRAASARGRRDRRRATTSTIPDTSTILGAAKLTGRLKSGTSLGFLGARHRRGVRARRRTGGVQLGSEGRAADDVGRRPRDSGVRRPGLDRRRPPDAGPSRSRRRRSAGGDADAQRHHRRRRHALAFKNRTYEAAFNVGFTHLDGEPAGDRARAARERPLPAASRPADDPARPHAPTLGGAQIQGSFNKVAGRHWLWGANMMIESPEFDPLDFGRLNYAGDVAGGPRLTYRETRPGRSSARYSLAVQPGAPTGTSIGISVCATR